MGSACTVTGVPIRRGESHRDTDTRREYHMRMEAKIGVTHLEAYLILEPLREYISVVLSHPVGGNLLWQP